MESAVSSAGGEASGASAGLVGASVEFNVGSIGSIMPAM